MTRETPKKHEGTEEKSDIERLTKWSELIHCGILSTVISPEALNLREHYFEFLAETENLAQDFDNYLNSLREKIGLPAHVEYKNKKSDSRDFLTIKQDKVKGAIRLIRNLRELDRVYKEKIQPSEELKKQYVNSGLGLKAPEADSLTSESEQFNSEYFKTNEYGDYANAINPCLFLKNIEMGYDSNSHYIAQLLHELSSEFKEASSHMSRFNIQIDDSGRPVVVYKAEEKERLRETMKKDPSEEGFFSPGMVQNENKPAYDPLPIIFQERANNLIKSYDSLRKEYSELYEANKALMPKSILNVKL